MLPPRSKVTTLPEGIDDKEAEGTEEAAETAEDDNHRGAKGSTPLREQYLT
jgi:hypothetical protein